MTDLRNEEVTELVTCALNKTGTVRTSWRARLRVFEHLVGKGLLEPVNADSCANAGHYPAVVPTLKFGAALRLSDAGRLAVLNLPVRAYGDYFPVASDVEAAQAKCEAVSHE